MKKNEILYILGYFFILFPTYFSEVVIFQPLLQVTMYLGIIILSILFIVSKIKENIINKKEFWFLFMCFIFSLFSSICSGSFDMIKLFLIIFSFKGLNFDSFLKKEIIIKILMILLVVFFYFEDGTSALIFFRDGKIRYTLGFSQPNQLALLITMISIELLYLNRNRNNDIIAMIIVLFGFVFNVIMTDSRASIFLTLIVSLAFIFRKQLSLILKKRNIFDHLFLVLTIISLLFVFLYNSNYSIIAPLDKILSSRIKWASVYFNYYGFNLFGKEIFIPYDFVKRDNVVFFCLDNAYIYFLLHFGIIFYTFLQFYIIN